MLSAVSERLSLALATLSNSSFLATAGEVWRGWAGAAWGVSTHPAVKTQVMLTSHVRDPSPMFF